ncbi:MAG: Hpt domain-containing protein [Myxococcota bacterium]
MDDELRSADSAIAQRDRGTLKRVGHTLKGNCRMVGAVEMGELAMEIERRAGSDNEDDCDGIATLLASFRSAKRRFEEALEQEREA